MPEVIGKELPTLEDFESGMLELNSAYREYVYLKKNIDALTKRQDELKKFLMSFVEDNGIEDDKGHKWFDMEEVEGYVGMQKQRRVAQKIDDEECYAILTSKELAPRCYELKPVLDQAEVMACFYDGLLTEDDIDAMFPKTVTNAFVLKKK